MRFRASFQAIVAFVGLLLTAGALADIPPYNMTPGVTEVSREIYGLHMLIFWICVVIGVGVFGVMFYSMYKHRKSKGATPAQFHENHKIEFLWTVIPAIILIVMAVPATKALINIYDVDDADISIKITGYQWYWQYEYLGEYTTADGETVDINGINFYSNLASKSRDQVYETGVPKSEHYLHEVDEPLYIPTGKKVRFLVTAADVIHSWWVPELAVKRDAIPGYINAHWTRVEEPGTFRGKCTELCGKDHAYMPVVVHAVNDDEFIQVLGEKKAAKEALDAAAGQTFSMEELLADGERIYKANCVACHGMNGEGGVGPAIAGSDIANGPILAHNEILVYGSKDNPLMASYYDKLGPAQIAAVITYQRNAFGNNTGDIVQPIDIVKVKQQGPSE